MRIGFDIRPLLFTKAGIAHYLYELIRHLAKEKSVSLSLFSSGKSAIRWDSPNIQEHIIRLPHLNSLCEQFWQEVLLPLAIRKYKIDIFHGVRFHLPARISCPSVVTIHDVAFKHYPQFVVPKAAKQFDRYTRLSIQEADLIIVHSEATKEDLIKFYNAQPVKIKVIAAAGTSISYVPSEEDIASVKRMFCINDDYLLFVGSIEPRKNLVNLIKAYASSSIRDKCYLVICGTRGWLYEELFQTVREEKLSERVIFTGFVTEEQKFCLYAGCQALILVSWYEGFGLPVVEAMQLGKATVVSNTSSLAEYFKDTSYLVEPSSIDEIRQALEQVVEQPLFRRELESRSREKAKEFSWEKTASLTVEVYKELLGRLK